jgi:hypothetical protein
MNALPIASKPIKAQTHKDVQFVFPEDMLVTHTVAQQINGKVARAITFKVPMEKSTEFLVKLQEFLLHCSSELHAGVEEMHGEVVHP